MTYLNATSPLSIPFKTHEPNDPQQRSTLTHRTIGSDADQSFVDCTASSLTNLHAQTPHAGRLHRKPLAPSTYALLHGQSSQSPSNFENTLNTSITESTSAPKSTFLLNWREPRSMPKPPKMKNEKKNYLRGTGTADRMCPAKKDELAQSRLR